MGSVALSTSQLNQLMQADPALRPRFYGTLACDELPKRPKKRTPQAYIVNTDRQGEPGQHWLALWTEGTVCELMDSFALPLEHYQATPLERWIRTHWTHLVTNGQSLQAIPSQSCGHYCLLYLRDKARGRSLQDFLNLFSPHDYVANDHRVGQMLKRIIQKETCQAAPGDQRCQ